MDMVPFRTLFPAEAARSERELFRPSNPVLERRRYRLEERYCIEPRCNCRRVAIWVIDAQSREVPAVLDHFLGDPSGRRPESHTKVNPWSEPGPRPLALLHEVRHLMEEDLGYLPGLSARYRQWKRAVDDPGHRSHAQARSLWASTARPRASSSRSPSPASG